MTEPTDAELDELRQANSGKLNFVTLSEFRTIARAVLAKWGTPPAVAGEPVAWMGTYDKTDLYYRKPPQADVVPLYATPQPTQAQAGAVPMSREEIDAVMRKSVGYGLSPSRDDLELVRAVERHHGITGGQHGTD